MHLSTESTESTPAFDHDGVDFLAETMLSGLSNWWRQIEVSDLPLQLWHDVFLEMVILLRQQVFFLEYPAILTLSQASSGAPSP